MVAEAIDGGEMAVDGGERLLAFGLRQLTEATNVAALARIPVDAVARFAQLWLGQKVGRAVAQPAADHGEQLAGDGVQRIAAHA
ncbi:MAG: hypothetical protein E6G95_12255 [Alphaproteobacteria bacterium]|nr:MAG: hypothetical protein E6G95_12255 [Alphaproteobacteria bacterium]